MTDTPSGPRLRYAIVGVGGIIAPNHIRALAAIPEAELVAVADIDPARGEPRAAEIGCAYYRDHHVLLADVRPDVVVITTPHPSHAAIARDSFAAGAHVLVEKPIAVQVSEADAMIQAADGAGRLLAVSFQQRFRPVIEQARALVDSDTIGPLVRALCVEPWYRPAVYYRSARWRGTWQGEGGGVLLNQAPHSLDLLCYLAGTPRRVWGWTRTRVHAIETEDTAQAMLEFDNGAPGYLTMSTAETGLQQRLQVVGENGAFEIIGDTLTVYRWQPGMREHMATATGMFSQPSATTETLHLPGDGGGHLAVHRDLYRAITEGGRPRTDGREALKSLELANAITLSSLSDQAVTLPIDRAAYAALLNDLRAGQRRLA